MKIFKTVKKSATEKKKKNVKPRMHTKQQRVLGGHHTTVVLPTVVHVKSGIPTRGVALQTASKIVLVERGPAYSSGGADDPHGYDSSRGQTIHTTIGYDGLRPLSTNAPKSTTGKGNAN